jgi:hypothetical protein
MNMIENCFLPSIKTDFDSPVENNFLYKDIIRNNLKKIIPKELLVQENDNFQKDLESVLPLMRFTPCTSTPSSISFYLLGKYRPNSFKFFFEMISRWLVPGKRLNVILVYAADFAFEAISEDLYTLCEVMIKIEDQAELDDIMRHLPIIETEVCLGVESRYYARRILEVKGLSADEKTAMIQEYIAYIVSRLPKNFQHDVFTEMQHVLVICRDEFKARRNIKHLSRIICAQYLFRKTMREKVRILPEKRHLPLKLFREQIFFGNSKKRVLGVLVGLNFMKDKEIFQETHLVKAIQHYVPSALPVENSFVMIRRGTESVCTLYLEVEKPDGSKFTGEEIRALREQLPAELEGCIEHMMHPVFMPRNEEEIMRNILSLSNQIKYLRDIPQMFVTFDEQTEMHLFFTITLVRVVKPGMQTIQETFAFSETFLEYIHDQCKTVGYLRKKYQKEATVFRVKVSKEQFLRRDHSIDLYKARQVVVSEISNIIGDVRDFNGGMISKQNELLTAIRKLLKHSVKYNDLLLENLFYSLHPTMMRTVLEPETLKNFFLMYLDAVNGKLDQRIKTEPDFVYVMVPCLDQEAEEKIKLSLSHLKINPSTLATASVSQGDTSYFGIIYRCDDPQKQAEFCKILAAV